MHSDFIVPKIQPDELLAGYRGRIAAWNSCDSRHEVARGMARLYPSANRWVDTSMQMIEATAAANNMTPEDVLRKHTPYILRATNDRRDLFSLSGAARLHSQFNMALYSHNKRVWGCAACMREDVKQLCFSYWRRSHQVPGRFTCPTHALPLFSIDEIALLPGGPAQSEQFIAEVELRTEPYCTETTDTRFVVELLETMLERFRRPIQQIAVTGIRAGLGAQGLAYGNRVANGILQERLEKLFSSAWLANAAGKLAARPESIARKVERALNPAGSCVAIDLAIVARLAFVSVEEALAALGLQGGRLDTSHRRLQAAALPLRSQLACVAPVTNESLKRAGHFLGSEN